ncbi:MAG TPA: hypothetical protein VGU20_20630 [Stellaceae bacterium]|nr:hypothetical protein [Stellaceae bacterium]
MPTVLERHKTDLAALIDRGEKMKIDLLIREAGNRAKNSKELSKELASVKQTALDFESTYQQWYTEAHAVIQQIMPSRLSEFEVLYRGDPKRKAKDIDPSTFTIQDWLLGIRAGTNTWTNQKPFEFAATTMRFHVQLELLKSVEARFASSLFDMRRLVQADLFDSEIDAARELLKHGFGRAAGVMAGVVLEKHLAEVCRSHSVPIKKKHASIGDFNDALKDATVLDVPTWRFIQRLGDLRNICGHNKDREPTADEVSELADGVEKITKTLY